MTRLWLLPALISFVACSSGDGGGADAGNGANDAANGAADAAGDAATPLECFDFSLDPDVPLAIDGTFSATSPTWRRPHDEPEVCPATALLPDTAAQVPFVAFAFCNNDSVEHTFDFEMINSDGPGGEAPLDDPFLFLYTGQGIPSDPLDCLAVNDDIPEALDAKGSEILGVTVPAGGAITMVGTTFTFAPNEDVGTGYYVLVNTNAD